MYKVLFYNQADEQSRALKSSYAVPAPHSQFDVGARRAAFRGNFGCFLQGRPPPRLPSHDILRYGRVRQVTESGERDRSHHSRAGNLIWSQRIYTFVSEPFDADP